MLLTSTTLFEGCETLKPMEEPGAVRVSGFPPSLDPAKQEPEAGGCDLDP